MSLPDYQTFMLPALQIAAEGGTHSPLHSKMKRFRSSQAVGGKIVNLRQKAAHHDQHGPDPTELKTVGGFIRF